MKRPVYILLFAALLFSALISGQAGSQDAGGSMRVTAGRNGPVTAAERTDESLAELDEDSTVQDYLAYAALNNPGLEAAFNRWKAALERIPQVKALPDPRFNYAFFIVEVETRVGPQRQKFGAAQTFPWLSKLKLKGDAAGEAAAIEKARYDAARLDLFYRVKQAYYEYYYLGRAVEITREHMLLMDNLERVARVRYSTGTAPHSDLIKAQVELAKLEDRVKTLEDLQGPAAARLNAALGREADAPVPWPKSIRPSDLAYGDDGLVKIMLAENPKLAAIDHKAAMSLVKRDLAKKDYYPDITLGVDYIDTAESDMDVEDSGKDPVIAMASVTVPIWYQKYRAAEKEADLFYLSAASEESDSEKLLAADLEMALYHFRDAQRKIGLYHDGLIPKAEEALSVARKGFTAGEATFLDVIDAERTYLTFQLEYERALSDKGTALAKIEKIAGRELAGEGMDTGEKEK